MPAFVSFLKRVSPLPKSPLITWVLTLPKLVSDEETLSTVFAASLIPLNALVSSFPIAPRPFPMALLITAFLAFDILLIKVPNISETPVHNVLASSKSPTRSRHVWAQPDPKASFNVSIN